MLEARSLYRFCWLWFRHVWDFEIFSIFQALLGFIRVFRKHAILNVNPNYEPRCSSTYRHLHTHTYWYRKSHMQLHAEAPIYIYIYIYICIYIYTHTHTYIYIHNITTIIYRCHMDISHTISNIFPLRRWLSAWCGTSQQGGRRVGCNAAHGRRGGDPLANQRYFMGKSWENHQ